MNKLKKDANATKRFVGGFVIMLIFLMLNYGSMGLFLGKYSKELTFILPFIISLVIFFIKILKKNRINITLLMVAIILIIAILLSVFINADFAIDNFILILVIFTAFFIVSSFTQNQLISTYVYVMFFLAIWSLISTYVLFPLCFSGKLTIFPEYTVTDFPFVDMFFTVCLKYSGVARNNGFCREPGVYQFFLLLASYFSIQLMPKNRKNLLVCIVFIITLLTTFSSIVYITIPICLFFVLKKYCNSKQDAIKYFFIILFLVIIIAVLLMQNKEISDEINRTLAKWDATDTNSNSLNVRVSGIFANIMLFFERPLFGYGLVNSLLEAIRRYGYVHVTGTTLIGFSAYGVVFGVLINYLLAKACKHESRLINIVWFAAIFISLSSQNLILSYVLWCFLFLIFAKKDNNSTYINT